MAWNAGILTLVGTLVIFAITAWLMRSAAETESAESVAPKIYGMRTKYFILLMIIIVVTLFATLRGLPYSPPNNETPVYEVSIVGKMWSWEITGIQNLQENAPSEAISAGKLVDFVVASDDVNHGIGIYNQAGQILTQTQAMPGYPAHLYYTFTEPGTYHVVCMEYCGPGHQVMTSQFTVQ